MRRAMTAMAERPKVTGKPPRLQLLMAAPPLENRAAEASSSKRARVEEVVLRGVIVRGVAGTTFRAGVSRAA
jgi:hypothetical protein